jgi:hypothetical protein
VNAKISATIQPITVQPSKRLIRKVLAWRARLGEALPVDAADGGEVSTDPECCAASS